jgi:hypothetical protein
METMTVFGLGLAIILSMGLSVVGYLILGVGEACCPGNTPGSWAYFSFAALLTLSAVVTVLYAVWAPPKPLLVWSWAIGIVTALEITTFQTYDPSKSTSHNLFFIFLQEWAIPMVWLPFGVAALCQFEAQKGPRTRKSSLGTQGA